MSIRIITDSSSDLPKEVIEQYNIKVVPLRILIDGKSYYDNQDITPTEFYKLQKEAKELPKTSQVPPQDFINAFKEEMDAGNKVLCITIGSKASGTCQSAFLAKQELESDDITVIDSNLLSMGTGYLVILAARMLEAGRSLEETIKAVEDKTHNNIKTLFCVDTMEYLKKGGRITTTKAFVVDILGVKPILTVRDAINEPIGKVRGRKKVIPYYLKHMETTLDIEGSEFIAIAHSCDIDFAISFKEAFVEKFHWEKPIYISEIGATVGTHCGPGVLAAFYLEKK